MESDRRGTQEGLPRFSALFCALGAGGVGVSQQHGWTCNPECELQYDTVERRAEGRFSEDLLDAAGPAVNPRSHSAAHTPGLRKTVRWLAQARALFSGKPRRKEALGPGLWAPETGKGAWSGVWGWTPASALPPPQLSVTGHFLERGRHQAAPSLGTH